MLRPVFGVAYARESGARVVLVAVLSVGASCSDPAPLEPVEADAPTAIVDAGPAAVAASAPQAPQAALNAAEPSSEELERSELDARLRRWKTTCAVLGGALPDGAPTGACSGLPLPPIEWTAFSPKRELSCMQSGGEWGQRTNFDTCTFPLGSDVSVGLMSEGCSCPAAMCSVWAAGHSQAVCVDKPAWHSQLKEAARWGGGSTEPTADGPAQHEPGEAAKPLRPIKVPKRGKLPAAELKAFVATVEKRGASCAASALAKHPELSGVVEVELMVGKDRRATPFQVVKSDVDDKEYLGCLTVAGARAGTLGPLKHGDYALVRHVFRIGRR